MQYVVEKLVLFIPEPDTVAILAADMAHRFRDVQEVLKELGCNVLIHPVVWCELERDAHQVQRIHSHPTGAVGLVDVSARGQLAAAVEHPNVVQSEEPALEDVAAFSVLAIHPPGEVQHQLMEDSLQELE